MAPAQAARPAHRFAPWRFTARLEHARIGAGDPNSDRLLSVDALRGFDMFLIVGGADIIRALDITLHSPTTVAINQQLDHVAWEGFQFWDIIMPLFMLLAGVSIPFAFGKRLSRSPSRLALWPHIIKRVLLLWVLGMVVQGDLLSYDPEQIIVYNNTLQAIAAGYLIAVLLALYLPVRLQIVATVLLGAGYWWVMDRCRGGRRYPPDANAALYIDQLVLGQWIEEGSGAHLGAEYHFGLTAMLGISPVTRRGQRAGRWSGWLPSSRWGGAGRRRAGLASVPPDHQEIWTGSFALFSGGLCYLLMALFYLVIDIWKLVGWSRFFIIIGSNSIFAYVAWHVFDFKLIGDLFAAGLEPFTGEWYPFVRYSIAFGVLFVILWFMYRKKVHQGLIAGRRAGAHRRTPRVQLAGRAPSSLIQGGVNPAGWMPRLSA